MGRRGPPPLPSTLKRARGTYRPCRESPSEPCGTRGVPAPPPDLDAEERAEWDELGPRLVRMGVLLREQAEAFELLVRGKVRYRRLALKVREMGEVIVDSKGDLVRNPSAIAMERAEIEYRRLLGEFGLSPAAATRVRAETAEAADTGATARRFFRLVHAATRDGRRQETSS